MKKLILGLSALLLLTGCSGLYNVPLPGGADLGDHPFRVSVSFHDVLDLVPQSAVKVNDVAVGRVDRVDLADDGRTATVVVLVNESVKLPANAQARLRQSSVLGEKFVELSAPPDGLGSGALSDGAVIPVERTNRNPEVEEVLGALSLLLNGGGIGQLQQITREMNNAMDGREPEVRALLGNLNTFVSGLDSHRGEIARAMDGMAKLSGVMEQRKAQITRVVTELTPGVHVLADQRESLVKMLKSLDSLSGVATNVIKNSTANLVADLRALDPTLRKLAEAGQKLPQAMEMLLTFPFPDSALNAIRGDYLNTYLRLHAQHPGPAPAGAPLLPLPSATEEVSS